uniref:Uncharacterized protein n=1 Tax=Triticum urartu TaxID=4572 RepID=A0A8R7PBM4_TRIUA
MPFSLEQRCITRQKTAEAPVTCCSNIIC